MSEEKTVPKFVLGEIALGKDGLYYAHWHGDHPKDGASVIGPGMASGDDLVELLGLVAESMKKAREVHLSEIAQIPVGAQDDSK